ncbi:putative transposase YdaD [Clostridium beijerinckii]|nr:putative transposase YdaD [Clostridium beijerinckii]
MHKRVNAVKNDISVEVHIVKKCGAQLRTYMTLLERDREKVEEGIEKGREEGILLTKKVLKLSNSGYTISEIAKKCNISEEEVRRILE